MSNLSLDSFHHTLTQNIKHQLGSLVSVSHYDDTDTAVKVPAVLVSLDDFIEDPYAGEGLTLRCNFSGYCVLDRSIPHAEQDVRSFAAELMRVIRKVGTKNLQCVGAPENMTALPAFFKEETQKYVAWVVLWEQTLELPYNNDDMSLVPFLACHGTHVISDDAPVTEDHITLPQG